MRRENLSAREAALSEVVRSSSLDDPAERERIAHDASRVLGADEFYHASLVVALFQFYNAFVDINGVDALTREGYEASGRRLSAHGYAPPARAAETLTPAAQASSPQSR